MKRVLFQGDSITDCDRTCINTEMFKGNGYATLVSSLIGFEMPGEYEFLNRGVSGNRITNVYARVKTDIVNLKPDVMSLLIGVNDVWHEVQSQSGVSAEKFETIYDMLIGEILEDLPNLKILIMEPFVTKGSATEEDWDYFRSEVEKRAEVAKRIADKYHLTFVPLQKKFDEMVAVYPEPYWTHEGVHPTDAGHELIAREWLKAFDSIK